MKLPLPTDYTRCLAHPPGHTARAAPKTWCQYLKTCARHQTISFDQPDGTSIVQPRLCEEHDGSFYIKVITNPEVAP